jgi:hypothetical protein
MGEVEPGGTPEGKTRKPDIGDYSITSIFQGGGTVRVVHATCT